MKSMGRFTYGDYRQWPEGERWELIDGVAYNMSPAPRRRHQVLAGQLFEQLSTFFRRKPCRPHIAPVDVFGTTDAALELDEVETVTQPDLFVVCDRNKMIDEGVKGPPDFIIEILSRPQPTRTRPRSGSCMSALACASTGW
jgi:Uma2 family endonuclease